MKTSTFLCRTLLIGAVLAVCFSACQRETAEEKAARELKESAEKIGESFKDLGENIGKHTEESLNEAMEKMGDAIEGLNNGEKVEPVNFRKLKNLMPQKLAGLERTDIEGQTSGALGFKVSSSEAIYEAANKRLELKIIDSGGIGTVLLGMAAWSSIEVDKENKDGYERTSTYKGYKTFEKYSKSRQSGEYSVLLAKRFILQLNGKNLSPDELEKAMKNMPLDELAAMK